MKLLSTNANSVMITKRFIGAVGLSVMALAIHAEVTTYAGESEQTENGRLARGEKVVAGPIAHTVTDIEVYPDGDRVSIAVAGDGQMYPEAKLLDESRLVIDIPAVTPAIGKAVVPGDHALLKRVRVGRHTDKVRLVLDLRDRPQFSLVQNGSDFLVMLKPGDSQDSYFEGTESLAGAPVTEPVGKGKIITVTNRSAFPVKTLEKTTKGKVRAQMVQMASDEGDAGSSMRPGDVEVGKTRFVGRRISLDFQQADITNILRLIAEVSGFNIVVGENVKAKVTMKLINVPWDQALDMLLQMNGLGMIRQGSIMWVDTLANLSKQQDQLSRSKTAKMNAEDVIGRLFYLRNVPAQEMMRALRPLLSNRGMIQFNQSTNAVVVRDTGTKLKAMEEIINGLDQEVPQVQIEARIVQADTVYSRGMGIQWGIKDSQVSPSNFHMIGNVTGPFASAAGTAAAGGASSPIARDFLVNLPAQVGGLPAVPSIGWTFGRLADGFGLDMRLSAGELLGLTKVIAAPKITTMDKREAKISQGESIPFQTTSLQGTQTTFVDANLELNVTPTIISRDPNEVSKRIQLKVRATRNAVGARSNPAGPSIDRREATTQVNMRDGETMVIGGVFVDVQGNNVQGVPYLSRIPVLGWLFKNKSESVSKQELLIFLTPTIVRI